MTTDLDPWREADLLRVLRTYASLSQAGQYADSHHVGRALDATDDVVAPVERQLIDLGLLTNAATPLRMGAGMPRRLTPDGAQAAISGKVLQQ